MKRAQAVALVAGTVLGLASVTAGVVLTRKEGREAARRLMGTSSTVAEQARKTGGTVARTAVARYQAQAPRAIEALSAALTQAPQAVEALSAKLPKGLRTGKPESAPELVEVQA